MTIFALSSGQGISGISVIRISGPETKTVISKLTKGNFPEPRVATLKKSIKSTLMSLLMKVYYCGFLAQIATQVRIWQNFMSMAALR